MPAAGATTRTSASSPALRRTNSFTVASATSVVTTTSKRRGIDRRVPVLLVRRKLRSSAIRRNSPRGVASNRLAPAAGSRLGETGSPACAASKQARGRRDHRGPAPKKAGPNAIAFVSSAAPPLNGSCRPITSLPEQAEIRRCDAGPDPPQPMPEQLSIRMPGHERQRKERPGRGEREGHGVVSRLTHRHMQSGRDQAGTQPIWTPPPPSQNANAIGHWKPTQTLERVPPGLIRCPLPDGTDQTLAALVARSGFSCCHSLAARRG
jgi:hypothetical protein